MNALLRLLRPLRLVARLHLLLLLLAPLLVTALSPPAAAAPERVRLRLDDGSDDSQVREIRGGGGTLPTGAYLREVQIDITGAGATVDYTLTKRLCGVDAAGTVTCGAWEPMPLATGTITGADGPPGTLTLELGRPRDEYQLTLTVTAGTPTAIRVWALYQ